MLWYHTFYLSPMLRLIFMFIYRPCNNRPILLAYATTKCMDTEKIEPKCTDTEKIETKCIYRKDWDQMHEYRKKMK
jgi:hypothetical protein